MLDKFLAFLSSSGNALHKLGVKRLIALGMVGLTLFGTILFSSFYLTRPIYEILYVGLSRDDVNRMGMALGEAGIAFDVSSDGSTVQVPVGQAEQARMFLAEKGLPTSNNAGYELFDNMGSLGLTSFMQEITRQRALEGEIARTIQAVQGVKAARVHIVLPDKGSFRKANQKPTASVVIRTNSGFAVEFAQSIRQLVAAAVPSLEASSVTVMDTRGQLLASGVDAMNGASMMMASLEQQVASQIDANIRKQLVPYLGLDHFQTSVQVVLDTDRRQTNETVFDPESQVVRSVRSVRDQADSQNNRNSDAVGVEQNIPQEEIANGGGERSTDKKDRREEITNYEINSKTISTVSDGYSVKKLAVAIVVDRARLVLPDGTKPTSENALNDEVNRIQQMVATAAGLDPKRGDIINVTAVDFVGNSEADMAPVQEPLWKSLSRYTSGLINGVALVIAVFLILFLGVRPLMREMREGKKALENSENAVAGLGNIPALEHQYQDNAEFGGVTGTNNDTLHNLRNRMRVPPQNRLEQMIAMDEERFAGVLREWVHDTDTTVAV
ncbi:MULTISPECIES: flagellar basal-body MS-ring/collar protein FliF [Bartonella]|uniref:Flagellar M-ring protein n=1 Tax=Bartonella rochalimae ATCC BAA-1498 TaxID=685782 RepID=A0A067W335_9HYPH|nr:MULTISPECIES: flagellar basal-body MS-ring/collar protein FliF [Bartonella]AQX23121.1 flagellar M-ring protein FliF [Bartonella sp. 11B]AQX23580.1 flagellar M-ring protein FliF [Bartonella sp. 114]AQX25576.1 flagellar M-ring protein FliF [Bartonella sp. Coyote22sub2]KEC54265.1 flagellar M-ring protein FliF [Bartonella rochalimae ATCC BAA-1498]